MLILSQFKENCMSKSLRIFSRLMTMGPGLRVISLNTLMLFRILTHMMVLNSSLTRIMSAASLQTSVPDLPIAIPMSAALSATESFTPSPVIPTIRPLACKACNQICVTISLIIMQRCISFDPNTEKYITCMHRYLVIIH